MLKWHLMKIKRYINAFFRRIGWMLSIIPVVHVEKNIYTIIDSSKKLEEIYDGVRRY